MPTQNENRDPLTKVWNRKYAFEKLEKAVESCVQVALLFIDVDRFKVLNDTIGPGLGDRKIIEIAREIESLSGENSLVSRIGGDEFCVILAEQSLEQAREIANAIHANRKPVQVEFGEKSIETLTLSIGIAHFPTHVSTWQNLFDAADLALLKANGEGKQGGRWLDGAPYSARNRVIAIGDFLDDFPEQSARFLNQKSDDTFKES